MSYLSELHIAHKARRLRLGFAPPLPWKPPPPPEPPEPTTTPEPPPQPPLLAPRDSPPPIRPGHVSITMIQHAVAQDYGVTVADLKSPARARAYVEPRQVAMSIAHEMCSISYPVIGRRFGGRDHTTVMHATRVVAVRLAANPELAARIEGIKEVLVAACAPKGSGDGDV